MGDTGSLPLYARIQADLRADIASGRLALGSRVPTESELSERYGVARMTARHAVDGLVSAGILTRRRGVGTFVSRTKTERVASRLLGFEEDARAHGLTPRTEVIDSRSEPLGASDAALLDLPPGTHVLRVTRRRFLGDEPVGRNVVVLVPPFDTLLAGVDLARSLYDAVAEAAETEVSGAIQRVEAVVASAAAANTLMVAAGSPLLAVTRITYVSDGRLLGLTSTEYRGDRYYLSLRVERSPPDTS